MRIEVTKAVIDVEAADVAFESCVETFTFIAGLVFSGQVGNCLLDISSRNRVIDNVDDAATCAIAVQKCSRATNNFDLLDVAEVKI